MGALCLIQPRMACTLYSMVRLACQMYLDLVMQVLTVSLIAVTLKHAPATAYRVPGRLAALQRISRALPPTEATLPHHANRTWQVGEEKSHVAKLVSYGVSSHNIEVQQMDPVVMTPKRFQDALNLSCTELNKISTAYIYVLIMLLRSRSSFAVWLFLSPTCLGNRCIRDLEAQA